MKQTMDILTPQDIESVSYGSIPGEGIVVGYSFHIKNEKTPIVLMNITDSDTFANAYEVLLKNNDKLKPIMINTDTWWLFLNTLVDLHLVNVEWLIPTTDLTLYEWGEVMMSRHHYIVDDYDEIYTYNNGCYFLDRKGKKIGNEYRNLSLNNYKESTSTSIIKQISRKYVTDIEKINTNPYLICFLNGNYNLQTGKLEPHTPNHITTIQIPWKYDENVKGTGKINELIGGVLRKEDIKVHKEFVGYSMTTSTNTFKKGLMLEGPTHSRKTTVTEIDRNIVGKKNSENKKIEFLSNDRFAKYGLKGRLLNISDDASSNAIDSTFTKSWLSGARWFDAEKKQIQGASFLNTCKVIVTVNKAPEPTDQEDNAYYNRWMIFQCDNVLEDDDPNRIDLEKLIDTITEEDYMEFIVECVASYREVLKNGKFSYNKTKDENKNMYKMSSNPITVFMEEMTESGDIEAKATLVDVYNEWIKTDKIKEFNLEPLQTNKFKLNKEIYNQYSNQKTIYGTKSVVFDIKLNDEKLMALGINVSKIRNKYLINKPNITFNAFINIDKNGVNKKINSNGVD